MFLLDRGDFRKRRERTRLTVPTKSSKHERLRNGGGPERESEFYVWFAILTPIRPLQPSSECNAATKGALYFNEQQKELYECDGQVWLKKSEQKCPTGWLEHKHKCYHMSTSKKNWSTAKNTCALDEATLTFINSKRLARLLAKQNRRKRFWVGYYKPAEGNSWKWLSGQAYTVAHHDAGRDLRSTQRQLSCMLGTLVHWLLDFWSCFWTLLP